MIIVSLLFATTSAKTPLFSHGVGRPSKMQLKSAKIQRHRADDQKEQIPTLS